MIGGTVCSVARLLRCKIEPVTNSSPCWKRFRCPTAAFRTWNDCQASRDRNAIYGYLSAVYGLVAWWTAEGREIECARRALRVRRSVHASLSTVNRDHSDAIFDGDRGAERLRKVLNKL